MGGITSSVPAENAENTGREQRKTHIGNFMDTEVREWDRAHVGSVSHGGSDCGCNSKPLMEPPVIDNRVEEWYRINAGIT